MFKFLRSIKTIILLSFIAIVMLFSFVNVYQIRTMQQNSERYQHRISTNRERISTLQDISLLSLQLQSTLPGPADLKAANDTSVKEYRSSLAQVKDNLLAKANVYKYYETEDSYKPAQIKFADVIATQIQTEYKNADKYITNKNAPIAGLQQQKLIYDQQVNGLKSSIEKRLKTETAYLSQAAQLYKNETKNFSDRSIFISIICGIVAALLSLLVTGTIARRLHIIRQGVKRMENGDFSASIPVKILDDIGQLALSFNEMAQRLKTSYHRLSIEKLRDEALLESMNEGIVAINEEGTIVLLNHVALYMMNSGAKDMVEGKPYAECLPLFDTANVVVPRDKRPETTTLLTGRDVTEIHYIKTYEGKKTLEIRTSPVIMNEQTIGIIVVLRDVTREKEVDRMKTEFISLASHQLRTPLSAIHWFAEMLLNGDAGKLEGEQKEFAQNIFSSTERMIELVGSLLNISRIESGRIIVDPKPTNLEDLIAGIVNDLKAKTEAKQQTLAISVHEGLGSINLDPKLIGQVFMNLLTNAIKYTPEGGDISVLVSKKSDNVVVQVSDNGYGIPKLQQPKIFQKFFRADNVTGIETDGTGLGLYLVKAIIESSHGNIWFESEEGKGTTFWFTLPLSGMQAKKGEVSLDS